jgi:peptide/nickel transport system substrate-binding protein
MENRFGIKDFFLFLLLTALIVLLFLQMKQYDRQWEVVQETRDKLREQTSDLSRIRRLLERGVVATTNPAGGGASAMADVDVRTRMAQEKPDYAEGDALIDIFTVIPDKLTPLVSTDLYSYTVQGYVLDTLLERDPISLKWMPRLASSWKISDDGLTIEYTLRRGVTFSDGEPLTADDVVFTMDWTMDEKIEAPRTRVYFDKLAKCEKTGENSVRFVFKEPYFKALEQSALVQVMSKKFYSRFTPKEFNESTGLLIGSGPYRLPDPTSWRPEPGRPIELVRNERYWGEPPAFNRLIWKVIELPPSRLTEFRNAGADLYADPTPEQFEEMKKDGDLAKRTQFFNVDALAGGYRYIGWNQSRDGKPTRFADPRVRQALTMLIDRQAVVRDVMKGYAIVNTGPFSHLSPQSDPSIKPWPFDPDAAQKLLAEAGYTKRGNVLVGPDGKEFRFQLMHGSTSDISKRVATLVKDNLARAGIIVEPFPTEWSIILDRTKQKQFDAVFMGWGGVVEEDPQQIFHSDSIKGVGDNFVSYSSKPLDELIDKARKVVKDEDRMPLWHQVHRILHEDQPYTFMFADQELTVLDNRIKNVQQAKGSADQGLTARTEWYVPAALQKHRN